MITIGDLREIAGLKGLKNIGYAEKDYLIDIILLSISRNTKDELVFKGGTCLYKFYKLDRFSEDLDFTLNEELDINRLLKSVISDLNAFGIFSEIKNKKTVQNSILITIKSRGPLWRNTPQSLSTIRIDINLKSGINLEPVLQKYNSLYMDIPSFSLLIMTDTEILAEKVRAVITRNYARDVYDIGYLLNKKVKINMNLINEKLSYYNKEYDKRELIRQVHEKKKVWKTELKSVIIGDLPEFEYVARMIEKHFK